MIHVIKNNILEIGINTKGAELEFINKDGVNRLWQRSDLWMRQSPILFPFIARLKGKYYLYQNQRYEMLENHGFANKSEFDIIELTETKIKLALLDNPSTYAIYPFNFKFVVGYELIDNSIVVTFEVVNKTDRIMYFQVGGHPGFTYDAGNGETADDYIVMFDEPVDYELYNHIDNFVEKKRVFSEAKRKFFIPKELIKKHDTVVFENVNNVTLISNTGKKIRIDCPKMQFLALWGKQVENPPFICLEPWTGLCDEITTNHNLEEKFTISKLNTNETYNTDYKITID